MKSEVTVVEAKQLKKNLEKDILTSIKAFEVETGCSVIGIDLQYNEAIGKSPEVYNLIVECSL